MIEPRASIEISRQPEEVFTFVFDASHHSEWDSSIVSVLREDKSVLEDSSELTVGSKTIVVHRVGPLKVATTEELVELDRPRQFANRGKSGPLVGTSRCIVEPLNDGRRTRLTCTLEIEARGPGKLLLPLARSYGGKLLPKQLNRIKEALERDGRTARR